MLKNVLGILGFLVILGLFFGSDDDKSTPSSSSTSSAEDRRKGFHCLSAWDGSHPEFKRKVKDMLRDPGSFEHIATYVSPVKEGRHGIRMEYRAKNGFGGMNIGQALGSYSNSTCAPVVLTAE